LTKSTIEIAATQRHMLLLGKVKGNKALSRAELVELKRYERQAAGRITAKARVTSKVQPKRKKRKAAATTKSVKKKRKARPPVDEAEVRRLGLECEKLTDADAAIKTRRSLMELFRKYPELRQAWDRGRFLRNLRDMARMRFSISKAAKKLGLGSGQILRAMIDEDEEIGDLWNQTQLEVDIRIRTSLFEAVDEGNPAAIRALENILRDEKDINGFDPTHIKKDYLAEIIGITTRTISRWLDESGLPRNVDKKTFNLRVVWAWHEEFIKKTTAGKGPAAELDPLKAMKAENLKMEIARKRHDLIDRSEMICSQVTWAQNIVTFLERSVGELSRLCSNQPREKIAEIHRSFFRDLLAEVAKVTKELCLPAELERELFEFLKKVKPYDDRS